MGLFQALRDLWSRSQPAAAGMPALSVSRRDIHTESVPADGKAENFDLAIAKRINEARMAHLDSLDLPLENKRVLDIGCGVGHLSQYFVSKGCRVVCADARQENIESLRQRYPNLEAHVLNIEVDSLSPLGTFDIVFAYGLLYHLENPFAALRSMASVCKEVLLLETLVCDHHLPILRMEDETRAHNQAVWGVGCRPSPAYVVMALNRAGFPHVYAPRTSPDHPDFQFEWKNNLDTQRDGNLLRSVFVASRNSLNNSKLQNLFEE